MARRIPIAPQTPEQQRPHIDMPDTSLPEGTRRVIPRGEQQAPITAAGLGKAGATGVRGGIEGGVGFYGDIPDIAGGTAGWIADKLGVDPQTAQKLANQIEYGTRFITDPKAKLAKIAEWLGYREPGGEQPHIMPTTADVGAFTDTVVHDLGNRPVASPEQAAEAAPRQPSAFQDITRHEAENPAERFMETSGQFAGTAFLPGGIFARATRPLVAGGVVEAAGGAVPADYEDAARIVAGLAIGAGMGAGQRGFKERSAMRKVGSTPGAGLRVRQLLKDQGMTDQEAVARMKELGSEATLMDVGPEGGGTTRQEAQRIQAAGGPGRGIIDPMLRKRETAANPRLQSDIRANVGPQIDREMTLQALKDRAAALSPEYEAAHAAQTKPVATQSILDEIDTDLAKVKSDETTSVLQKIKKSLFLRDTDQLDPSSEGLHEARKAIDSILYDSQGRPRDVGGQAAGRLNYYRQKIDEALGEAGPIKEVDVKRAQVGKEERAFGEGEKVLETGRPAQSPEEFQRTWEAMNEGERGQMHAGMSREIDRLTGVKANDRVELKRLVAGEGKWNHQKIATIIGQEKADALLAALEREKIFQETYQKVVQGSKTAETQGKAGGGIVAPLVQAGADIGAGFAMGGTAGAGGALMSNVRRMAQDLMTSRGAGAKEAAIAKLLTSNEPDKVAAGLKIMRERGSIMPQAAVTALLARQQDVSEKRQR